VVVAKLCHLSRDVAFISGLGWRRRCRFVAELGADANPRCPGAEEGAGAPSYWCSLRIVPLPRTMRRVPSGPPGLLVKVMSVLSGRQPRELVPLNSWILVAAPFFAVMAITS
jgi:hypothetical protein